MAFSHGEQLYRAKYHSSQQRVAALEAQMSDMLRSHSKEVSELKFKIQEVLALLRGHILTAELHRLVKCYPKLGRVRIFPETVRANSNRFASLSSDCFPCSFVC